LFYKEGKYSSKIEEKTPQEWFSSTPSLEQKRIARMVPFDNVRLVRDSVLKQSKQAATQANPNFFNQKQQLPSMSINSNKFAHEQPGLAKHKSFNNWDQVQHHNSSNQSTLLPIYTASPTQIMGVNFVNHDPSEISDSESNDERKMDSKKKYKEEI
jgi:hypothetical protein